MNKFPRAIALAERIPLKVFVFAGQSNMTGMRSITDDLPKELNSENPDVYFFNGEHWVPIAPGRTEEKGFGPEISFSKKLQKAWGEPIGIVKLSKGDTMLATHWNPQNQAPSQYKQLLAKVQAAKATCTIEIVGTIWMQGESDAAKEKPASAYGKNLALLIDSLRTDFVRPQMLFLAGRVNPPEDSFPLVETVRKAQEECKASNYGFIDCDDLEKGPDHLHYTTQGIVEMGTLFAETILSRMPTPGPVSQ